MLAACCLGGCNPPAVQAPATPPPTPSARPTTGAATATTAGPATATTAAPAAKSVPDTPPRPTALRDISFDDIKIEMQKGDPFTRDLLPARVTSLENCRVRIRGYILPSFQQTGLTQFVLVRDNMECCFGPGALLHDCVVVRMVPGTTANFSIRPVAVSGTFRVAELRGPDGRHLAIYALDGEKVQ